jgi:hypothetical protein
MPDFLCNGWVILGTYLVVFFCGVACIGFAEDGSTDDEDWQIGMFAACVFWPVLLAFFGLFFAVSWPYWLVTWLRRDAIEKAKEQRQKGKSR